jgi:hypothetical protein
MHSPEREMRVIEMKMHNIELRNPLKNVIEHQHYEGQGILTGLIEPERCWAGRNQPGAGNGITAREQRNLMPLSNKFFR